MIDLGLVSKMASKSTLEPLHNQADSSQTVRVRDSKGAEWRELVTFPYGEEGGMVDFGPEGTAYMLSSIGRETTALLKVSHQTTKHAATATLSTASSNAQPYAATRRSMSPAVTPSRWSQRASSATWGAS